MTTELATRSRIPAMSDKAIDRVRTFERENAKRPQTPITTHHLIHAGLYARTITIPAGVALTGALIKRSTVLILNGDALVATDGDGGVRFTGYHVLHASANRKQAFVALTDTQLTMLFATEARDVQAAEEEFTDEAGLLFSRHGENITTITGE